MKTALKIMILLATYSLYGQNDKITNLLSRDWYALGFGDKKINTNDTVNFVNNHKSDSTCDYLQWSIKAKGIFKYHSVFTQNNHRIGVEARDNKWFFDKKRNELFIYKEKSTEIFKVLNISEENLKVVKMN